MRPVSIGLVGYGIWGRNILRDLRELGHSVTVAESDGSRWDEAVRDGASGAVGRAEELPNGVGLIVATPASTHAAVVRALLPRGVPILVEKPLTTDVASAREIVERAGERVFVGHVWCYHPGIEALAAIARTEELGPVQGIKTVRTNWTSPRKDVDSSWNLAPHDLAIAQFVLGGSPTPRFAVAEIVERRCVGLVGVLGGSPWAVFEVSNRYREKRREVRLHCRDGVAVLPDTDSGQIELARIGPGIQPVVEARSISRESALRRELAAFCEHLRGGPPPPTPAADGLRVVEAIVELRRLAGLVSAGA